MRWQESHQLTSAWRLLSDVGDSPRTPAELDLFCAEVACKLQAAICANPRRCGIHRCRRLDRCRELEETMRLVQTQRARMAQERAAQAKQRRKAGPSREETIDIPTRVA